ncbi:hypothetical protein [Bathymodiolus thermophilus thioautotrophic gill symbiont]|uniref:Uncharacterized protein n=2 Tax=Bathymodiolus thermophilus thioautotrophic gill symbiont TaxID=2360 RepID=A0A1J5UIK0_9GAMM|nr:hypothetical protein [Bathymodiolus thermophilus thioautotrophic gill symbiont]OIR25733.1 hypothetical protein BGC33_15265 [Bathymodiolus thermophilus thioautotrophic gill symbiont]
MVKIMAENDVRVNITIVNTTKEKEIVRCTDIRCSGVSGLEVGDLIQSGDKISVTSTSNNRIFFEFEGAQTKYLFQIGCTCPKSSNNSACGYGNSGLQCYQDTGTPVSFVFHLGKTNKADWDNKCQLDGSCPDYGACS